MNQLNPSEQPETSLSDKLFAGIQTVLPHHLLSRLMFSLTRSEWPPLAQTMIKGISKLYNIDIDSAAETDITRYKSFNAFFTRALREDARPISADESAIVSPVDGTVSQAGPIVEGEIFQAKGHSYALSTLLGDCDQKWIDAFENGLFTTIYLSPRDYHRIHMPQGGQLEQMLHVPGRLYSVSPSTTRTVPGLFARNERVVNLFETENGPMAVIMVGAIFVASMDTVWAGTVAPANQRITQWDYQETSTSPITLDKGQEMGRFNMGSTVILLFGENAIQWEASLTPGKSVQMGEPIGSHNN